MQNAAHPFARITISPNAVFFARFPYAARLVNPVGAQACCVPLKGATRSRPYLWLRRSRAGFFVASCKMDWVSRRGFPIPRYRGFSASPLPPCKRVWIWLWLRLVREHAGWNESPTGRDQGALVVVPPCPVFAAASGSAFVAAGTGAVGAAGCAAAGVGLPAGTGGSPAWAEMLGRVPWPPAP